MDDVVRPKEIEEGEATDAIAEALKTDDSLKQDADVDLRDDAIEDDLEAKASEMVASTTEKAPVDTAVEPEVESPALVSSASPSFFGRMKKITVAKARAMPKVSFERLKKFKKGTPSRNAFLVEDNIAVEEVMETHDSVHEKDAVERHDILETKDSVQPEDAADIRHNTLLESAEKEELVEAEVPSASSASSASDDSLKEKVDIVAEKKEDAATEDNEEASTEELKAPSVDAKESSDEQPNIEAVQQDGMVALGYFQPKDSTMKEEDGLLAQTRQFAESAALMMEQSCLSPCSGRVLEWHASVTPKVQEWQASVVPIVQEWQAKIMPVKLMSATTETSTTPELTSEEEDRNDSTLDEKTNLVLSEENSNEVRVM